MELPGMYHIHQQFGDESIKDIESEAYSRIAAAGFPVGAGKRIAVTVGSRGIAGLEPIVRGTVRALQDLGAIPFIIPAMGSHGGGTAEGQAEVLASYGITEQRIGAPVISSMEVVELEAPGLENRVFIDKHAWEADGVLLLNRVKPHTDFHGQHESGLLKMSVIGLGKHRLADEIHSFGTRGLKELIRPTAGFLIGTGKIVGGIGVVENSRDEVGMLEAIPVDQLLEADARLLVNAREMMPKIPVSDIDVLIVDEMGKDISGCGMDTNIIGRIGIRGEAEPEYPGVRSILVTDLTAASHGNALGVGLADVITRRLFDKIDYEATKANIVTSSFLERGKIPIVGDTDEDALRIALRAAGCRDFKTARICRIRSTLELADVLVSSSLKAGLNAGGSAEVLPGEYPLLDGDGAFIGFPEIVRAG